MHKFAATAAFVLLCLGLIGNTTPYVDATLNGDSFVKEIATIPSGANLIAADSTGRLFLAADNDIYYSLDSGATWTKTLDGKTGSPHLPFLLFVDYRDYIYTQISTDTLDSLWRSTDHGMTWAAVLNNTQLGWHMTESANGTLYWNTYTTDNEDRIYASSDGGATWSIFYDMTNQVDHFHWVEAHPSDPNILYVSTGDGVGDAWIQRYNGTAWETICNSTDPYAKMQTTSIAIDDDYVYFFNDASNWSVRMPHSGTSTRDFEGIFDLRSYLKTSNNVYDATKNGDVFLFGTSAGQLWASWDGKRWVKVFDAGEGHIIRSISRKGFPHYFVDTDGNRLYRLSLTKEDVIQQFFAEYNMRRGFVSNNDTYTLEQRITNGTNYLDLTEVALTNVHASIEGLSVAKTAHPNAGFEWNNKTGWEESLNGGVSSIAEDSANGTYAYRVIKTTAQSDPTLLRQTSFIKCRQGDKIVLSFFAKATTPLTNGLVVTIHNGTGSAKARVDLTLTTSWKQYTFWYIVTAQMASASHLFTFQRVNQTTWIDSVMFYVDQTVLVFGGAGSTNSVTFLDKYHHYCDVSQYIDFSHPIWETGTLNTQNPSLTIDGQTVSYLGTLTNGTESASTSLSGIIVGAVQVDTAIQGSGQAIVKITGTRVLYEDSAVFEGRRDAVFFGRYYDDFLPVTTTTDLIVVTNLEGTIKSLSSTSEKTAFAVDSSSSINSTIKVYVGDRGQPWAVLGAASWDYSVELRIITINATQHIPREVVIYWIDSVSPTTLSDYDGLWHSTDFTIQLTATDEISGVAETFYKMNDGPIRQVGIEGHPFFTAEGRNNTLEYWSVDNAGNEENHHILTEIKLDKTTPTGSIAVNNNALYATSVTTTLSLAANDLTSGVALMRLSNDNAKWTNWEAFATTRFWTLTIGDGTKTVYIQYKDSAGLSSQPYQDTIILDTTRPVANAGPNQTVSEDSLVTLNASNSSDNIGIATYIWTLTDVSIKKLSGERPTYVFEMPGVYRVTLNVTDNAGHWAADTVIINVLDITKPIAYAGPNRTVNVGAAATFDASASTDNTGIVSYHWDFGEGTHAEGKVTAHTFQSPGEYTVTLTVGDAAGNTATHQINIKVLFAIGSPLMTTCAAILAIGIAITAVLLLRIRRKRVFISSESNKPESASKSGLEKQN